MKIYLDTSTLNRIFDDQSQIRIALEAKAVQSILLLLESHTVDLYSSEALTYEISRNPYPERQTFCTQVLQAAQHTQALNPTILERGQFLETHHNLGAIDALHVACAEQMDVDYLITCDDRLIKRYLGSLTLCNPVQFILTITSPHQP